MKPNTNLFVYPIAPHLWRWEIRRLDGTLLFCGCQANESACLAHVAARGVAIFGKLGGGK